MEQLLAAFLRELALAISSGRIQDTCLPADHPLVSYYSSEKAELDRYLALDDTAIWGALEAASRGPDELLRRLASRLRNRGRLKAIEISTENPNATDRARRAYIEKEFADEIGKTVFVDRVPLTIYGGLKAGEAKSHKRVRVLRSGEDRAVDITTVSKAINALTEKQELLRYYFVDDAACERVNNIRG